MEQTKNLESLSKELDLEKSLDFILFRQQYIDNYDFERLN